MKKILTSSILISTILLSGLLSYAKETIVFSSWANRIQEKKALSSLIEEFEKKNKDIHVIYRAVTGDYNDYLKTQISAGGGPDIFYVDAYQVKQYISLGTLEEIKNYDTSDFCKPLVNVFKSNGKLIRCTKDYATLALFYNKNIFKKRNIEIPKSNMDWNDFIALTKKLTKDDIYGLGFALDLARMEYQFKYEGIDVEVNGKSEMAVPKIEEIITEYYQNYKNRNFITPKQLGRGWNGELFLGEILDVPRTKKSQSDGVSNLYNPKAFTSYPFDEDKEVRYNIPASGISDLLAKDMSNIDILSLREVLDIPKIKKSQSDGISNLYRPELVTSFPFEKDKDVRYNVPASGISDLLAKVNKVSDLFDTSEMSLWERITASFNNTDEYIHNAIIKAKENEKLGNALATGTNVEKTKIEVEKNIKKYTQESEIGAYDAIGDVVDALVSYGYGSYKNWLTVFNRAAETGLGGGVIGSVVPAVGSAVGLGLGTLVGAAMGLEEAQQNQLLANIYNKLDGTRDKDNKLLTTKEKIDIAKKIINAKIPFNIIIANKSQ